MRNTVWRVVHNEMVRDSVALPGGKGVTTQTVLNAGARRALAQPHRCIVAPIVVVIPHR